MQYVGMLDFIKPVMTLTEGRCVATNMCIPHARAFELFEQLIVLLLEVPSSLNQLTHQLQ